MAQNNMNQLLLDAGISYLEATAAVPFLFFSPNASDPDMTPVKIIIRAIQAQLNKNRPATAQLALDGVMGAQTSEALRLVTPPGIVMGTAKWYDLLQYAIKNKPRVENTGVVAPTTVLPVPSLSGIDLTNPWVIGGGLALLYLLTRKSKRSRR